MRHLPNPVEWCFRVLLIDKPLDPQIFGVFWDWLVVPARPRQPQKFALPLDAKLAMVQLNQRPEGFRPIRRLFF
jgi:hypothetical protein